MSATNQTPILKLPQFVGSDKPSWLGDFNGAMSIIDTAVGLDRGEIQTAKNAAATAQTAATAAQTAADAASTRVTALGQMVDSHGAEINSLDSRVESLEDQLASGVGAKIEFVNGSFGGYSSFQIYKFSQGGTNSITISEFISPVNTSDRITKICNLYGDYTLYQIGTCAGNPFGLSPASISSDRIGAVYLGNSISSGILPGPTNQYFGSVDGYFYLSYNSATNSTALFKVSVRNNINGPGGIYGWGNYGFGSSTSIGLSDSLENPINWSVT